MRSYIRNRSLMGSSDGPHVATRTNGLRKFCQLHFFKKQVCCEDILIISLLCITYTLMLSYNNIIYIYSNTFIYMKAIYIYQELCIYYIYNYIYIHEKLTEVAQSCALLCSLPRFPSASLLSKHMFFHSPSAHQSLYLPYGFLTLPKFQLL